MTTWSDVVAFAPELSSTPLSVQTTLLAYGDSQVPEIGSVFAENYALARIYLIAHFATLAQRAAATASATAGNVTSMTEGGLSVGYSSGFSAGTSIAGYTSTTWGALYLEMCAAARGPRLL